MISPTDLPLMKPDRQHWGFGIMYFVSECDEGVRKRSKQGMIHIRFYKWTYFRIVWQGPIYAV